VANPAGFAPALNWRRKKEPALPQPALAPNVFPNFRESSSSHCLMPPLLAAHLPQLLFGGTSHGY
jgi:hypothetical protein